MRKKSKLSRDEYQVIFSKYYESGWSQAQISRYLGRNKSTISRVLGGRGSPRPGTWNLMSSYEKGSYAYEKSQSLMSAGRRRPRLKTERIRKVVKYLLCRKYWSPEIISDFLKKHGLNISGKAIYNFIKKEQKSLKEYLRLRGKRRRSRVMHERGFIKSSGYTKKNIRDRPDIYVKEKIEPGHWEIDTVHTVRNGGGAVGSLRELSSRNNFFFILPDLKAESLMRVLVPFFHALPQHMKKTLTADNGPENADLNKLEIIFPGLEVYYCDPYKACQRGAVENGNGQLRWFFPKGTDFSKIKPEELKVVESKINTRPMKVNNYQSPKAVYNEILKAA